MRYFSSFKPKIRVYDVSRLPGDLLHELKVGTKEDN